MGMGIGLLGVATGGKARRRGLVFEFCVGAVAAVLERHPLQVMALTLGHAVLALNQAALDVSRDHERVHVGQYDRWGLLFVPAYLLCSLGAWLAGKNVYRDNPFERAAFAHTLRRPH